MHLGAVCKIHEHTLVVHTGSHAARHASVEAWALEDMHHMVQLRRRAELLRGGAERDMDAELRMQVETGPKRTVTSIATPPRQIAAPRVQIVPAPASAASSTPPVAAKLEVPPQKNTKWFYGDWLCAAYTTGQDDAWCAKNPTASGFEYKMSHGDGTCGSCWCCRRSREVDDGKHPRPQVLRMLLFLTSSCSVHLETAWMYESHEFRFSPGATTQL